MTIKSTVDFKPPFSNQSTPLKKCLNLALGGFLLLLSGLAMAQSDVVINEILQNPSAVSDGAGEWFELTNTTASDIDIDGWTIKDDGADNHVISNAGPLIIPAGGYLVLGNNVDSGTNGGVSVAYNYGSSFFLSNGADELVLLDGSQVEIDRVNWDGGATYPDPNGASMSLLDPALDNNVGSNWCESTTAFGAGDLGTPGAANTCEIIEEAPSVTGTTPADGAVGIPLNSDIVINFSEAVDATGSWFTITCTVSNSVTAAVSGGPQIYTLNPDADLANSETCTVNIVAAMVTDTDADDPPDTMAADYSFSFTITDGVIAELVINEVDYDQPGTDAGEFVEIRNNGADPVGLAGYTLELANGNNGSPYNSIDLPDVILAAGDYFVICGDPTVVPSCDLDVSPNTNLIQNGAPDGMALLKGGVAIDALSYEGDMVSPYIEGSGVDLFDSSGIEFSGISRTPDGNDTGANNVDFEPHCITPGKANSAETTGCTDPRPPALKVNEIDYDQPGTDTAEFVEIFNAGNSSANLSNVDLVLVNGNGAVIYTTVDLPDVELGAGAHYVVCANAANVPNCDLEGFSSVQNGAPDAVALLVDGELVDTVSYEGDTGAPYTEGSGVGLTDSGATGMDNRGISRFPNGVDSDQNNVDLTFVCITPGYANTSLTENCEAGGAALEIHDIQGSADASPYANQGVSTLDNIVTAVGPEGFFIQTPDARLDGDTETSNGIYVFTDGVPTVAVGDQVDVSGEVTEFYGFTEFAAGSIVNIDSSGNTLPAILSLDAATPSPDPASPSCAVGTMECFEGMLVEIASGTVTGGNQDFGSDPTAEFYITASNSRTYREPGIIYPGVGGTIPTWDGNPEVFEMDPDRLGLANVMVSGGSSFTASGVIGFEFGDYEFWPTSLAVTGAALPLPVRSKMSSETTVGSLNLFRFATDGDYDTRLTKFSLYIRDVLNSPDVLAVQEAESMSALQDLVDQIAADDGSVIYTPYLVEGNDIGGIDVGFLVRSEITVDAITQLGADEIFSYDDSLLHDRPPLLLEGTYTGNGQGFPLAVMVVHNRSLNGIETERVQLKRLAQAESIAEKVQVFQTSNPATPLVVIGDFNAFEFTDGYVDAVGHIMGDFNPAESIQSGLDLVDPNLTNQVELLAANERYSFVYEGNAQALDHALTTTVANTWVRGLEFGRGNADAAHDQINDPLTAERASDHDGMVLFLMTDWDGDGVADDVDGCPFVDGLDAPDAEFGCQIPIPTLGPVALWLMLLMIGGLGLFTLRGANGLTRR